MVLKLCITSVTSSRETKSHQNDMIRILQSRAIPFETVDISVDKCLLEEMREKSGNACAFPPQLFRGDKYLGGFDEFMTAVEDENLDEFLK